MIRKQAFPALLLGLALAAALPGSLTAQAVVRTVFFYSPYCPHCHKVMTEDLPPLSDRYGRRLVIVGVDVTRPQGQALYQATADHFGIPEDRRGVPLMVVGEEWMMGEVDIPRRLPGLIEEGLAVGGVTFPAVPELQAALVSQGVPPTSDAAANLTVLDRLRRDPVGNGAAVTVLVLLVAVLAWALAVVRSPVSRPAGIPTWVTPLLTVVGMGVAAYLSFVEVTGSSVMCGPVGDCNAVQQSAYARLFGVLPVGELGLVGYLAMLVVWAVGRSAGGSRPRYALWLMALAGTAFSAYLTFLEPFVIGATCVWCITSAVAMALLLLVSTAEMRSAAAR